jgi:hypothetical protein
VSPLRRRLLIPAVVLVGLGAACSVTGPYREATVRLLMIGIAYAVAVLAMDGRRRC